MLRQAHMGVGLLFCLPAWGLTISDIPLLIEKQNAEVQAAEKDVQAASQSIWTARARYYPAINVLNTYLHVGNNLQVQMPTTSVTGAGGTVTGSFTLAPITLQMQDVALSNLVVKMPLFTGGRISAGVDAAKAKRDEAVAAKGKITEEKTQEALNRYFGVVLAKEVTGTLRSLEGDLSRIRTIAESLVKTGLGTKFAVTQVKVAQAELASKLAEASGKAEVADLAFKVSIGKEAGDAVTYETPLHKAPLPAHLDQLKLGALEHRSEFQVLEAKAQAVKALKAARFGESLPTLYAVGSKVLLSQNLPVLQPNWMVGVVLDIPITGLFTSISEQKEAYRLEEKVAITRIRAELEIPLLIEKNYAELRAAEAGHTAMQDGVELAKESLRLAEVRFKSGNGSALEVLKSTTDLEQTQIRYTQLTEEFNHKLLELYTESGDVRQFIEAYNTGEKR